jgi:hypothetical protein
MPKPPVQAAFLLLVQPLMEPSAKLGSRAAQLSFQALASKPWGLVGRVSLLRLVQLCPSKAPSRSATPSSLTKRPPRQYRQDLRRQRWPLRCAHYQPETGALRHAWLHAWPLRGPQTPHEPPKSVLRASIPRPVVRCPWPEIQPDPDKPPKSWGPLFDPSWTDLHGLGRHLRRCGAARGRSWQGADHRSLPSASPQKLDSPQNPPSKSHV